MNKVRICSIFCLLLLSACQAASPAKPSAPRIPPGHGEIFFQLQDAPPKGFSPKALNGGSITHIDLRIDRDAHTIAAPIQSVTDQAIATPLSVILPIKENYVVTITGKTGAGGAILPGAVIRAVFDVTANSQSIPVNQSTTPLGELYYHFYHDGDGTGNDATWEGYALSLVPSSVLSYFNAISSYATAPTSVDIPSIVSAMKANNGQLPSEEISESFNSSASLIGSLSGLAEGETAIIQANDPGSPSGGRSSGNGWYALCNVTPNLFYGTPPSWTVTATAPSYPSWGASYTVKYYVDGTTTGTNGNSASISNIAIGETRRIEFSFHWPTIGISSSNKSGANVTINGSNLHPAGKVFFGSTEASGYTSRSRTQYVVTFPAGAASSGTLSISTGEISPASIAYSY